MGLFGGISNITNNITNISHNISDNVTKISNNISTHDNSTDNTEAEEEHSILSSSKDLLVEGTSKTINAAIKGSGFLIRKVYETKINVVKEFTDIDPDWYFIDDDTLKKKIHNLEKIYEDEEKRVKYGIVEAERLELIENEILVKKSLLKNNLRECERIVNSGRLNTPFALYGIACLIADEAGDKEKALNDAEKYYRIREGKIEHPKIGLYLVEKLTNEARYEQALKIIGDVIKAYPENKRAHELLFDIHTALGNSNGAEVEKNIISIL
ncbi:MAG: hypothetical protein SO022_04985 [Selenomonadaceae bacterium]|nr:hypothetical protein [Selenomonadaceae bacterium]